MWNNNNNYYNTFRKGIIPSRSQVGEWQLKPEQSQRIDWPTQELLALEGFEPET